MKTFVATSNEGKLVEMAAIFAGTTLELQRYPEYVALPEGETSYADNALMKARSLQRQLTDAGIVAWVLADDSGLEVDALDHRPGVLSARYAGEDATWQQRRLTLLDELDGTGDSERRATFICHMALVFEDGESITAYGAVGGRITALEEGRNGFGYDPVFYFERAGRTFAELTDDEKNRCSHRRHAAEHLLTLLRAHGR